MSEPKTEAAEAPGPSNLSFGPEAGAAHALALLRGARIETRFRPGEPLVPGVWLDADGEARPRGQVRAGGGALLDLDVEIDRSARWLAVHVAFGGADLSGVQVLGVALRAAAPAGSVTARPCLRSGLGEDRGMGFVDAFLPKTAVATEAPALHLDALDLTVEGRAPLHAPWREVVLFLEPRPQRLRLLDMRVFAI